MYQIAITQRPLDIFLRHFAFTYYARLNQYDQTYGFIHVDPFEIDPFDPNETLQLLIGHPIGQLMFFVMSERDEPLHMPKEALHVIADIITHDHASTPFEDLDPDRFHLQSLEPYGGLSVDDLIYKRLFINDYRTFDQLDNYLETAKEIAIDTFDKYRLTRLQITFDLYENEPADSGYCAEYSAFLTLMPTSFQSTYCNPIRGGGFLCI